MSASDRDGGPPCLFCRIVAGDITSDRVLETDSTYAFRDVNPQAPVHVLVVPKDHVPHVHALGELGDGEGARLAELFGAIREVARQEGLGGSDGVGEPGYRVVANVGPDGGMSVAHLHFHVLGARSMQWPPG